MALLLTGAFNRGAALAPAARANDNRTPAGSLRNGALTVTLDAELATWHPDGDDAPGAVVPAFAEEGGPPEIPGPLIRVPAGTDVVLTLRNRLDAPLIVHGLYSRPLPDSAAEILQLAAGGTRTVRFRLSAPGTYHYWGTSTGQPALARRFHQDAQLGGVIVVDAANGPAPADRIIVIGMWADTVQASTPPGGRDLFVLNGRSWPHTERLSYNQGDTVRWRVVNLSALPHPMHLHGFYFRVDARGDGRADTTYADTRNEREVTDALKPGEVLRLTWVAERPGNWLFHCHLPLHLNTRGPLGLVLGPDSLREMRAHGMDRMNGLILGITVRPRPGAPSPTPVNEPTRHLRLLARENLGSTVERPEYEFALGTAAGDPPPDSGHRAGPTIVLTRGQPVAINVVNRTPEYTTVHWHGIELESYYDGVGNWSGDSAKVAPAIAPGDSFEARFTPPHAGTFIYHTHVNEVRQEPAGLSGALVVLDSGQRWDSTRDIVVLVSEPSDPAVVGAVLVNGAQKPPARSLRVGGTYRLRFINIAVVRPSMVVQVARDSGLAVWRVIAKDGATPPAIFQGLRPARHPLSVGETLDAEITPDRAGTWRVEARTATGKLLGAMALEIR